MQDHGIGARELVFAVTEGGETTALIGAVLAAAAQAGGDRYRAAFEQRIDDPWLRVTARRSL
ncbi:hypothetical protein [Xanthomonas theicola]|uniref:Uncharacterized protein n=1 Tax=Xanthomonas theicola TaxID=56464 RepID=A0A2S6ZF41_9XANT|nr:hypothetical protein [Xanthomonas theicola]PPT90863.1 hypothetical protein XthCFBP4691_10310 [Xanthomonas theicola]